MTKLSLFLFVLILLFFPNFSFGEKTRTLSSSAHLLVKVAPVLFLYLDENDYPIAKTNTGEKIQVKKDILPEETVFTISLDL